MTSLGGIDGKRFCTSNEINLALYGKLICLILEIKSYEFLILYLALKLQYCFKIFINLIESLTEGAEINDTTGLIGKLFLCSFVEVILAGYEIA